MKCGDLIRRLERFKDFDIEIVISDITDDKLNVRTFKDVDIADIGYSDKVVLLSGDED